MSIAQLPDQILGPVFSVTDPSEIAFNWLHGEREFENICGIVSLVEIIGGNWSFVNRDIRFLELRVMLMFYMLIILYRCQ